MPRCDLTLLGHRRDAHEPPQFVEEIMPSNTSKIWTKVVVPIEAYQCDLTKFATTRQFGDLFSWAGVGVLSTEELAKALRDQSSPPRRGMAFLVNHGEHAYHLVTNSQVLFGAPQDATDSPTTTPKRSWLLDYDEENRLGADSSALKPVSFLSLTIEPTKLHWFPVISYPDLNIAVVNIDRETKLCQALLSAGHIFASTGDFAEEPSVEGAEIIAVGLVADRSSLDYDICATVISEGIVISSQNAAPFFLMNVNTTPGGLIVERDRIVGISTAPVSPRFKEEFPNPAPPHFSIAAKGSYLKALLRAHQQGDIC